eukprot:1154536-Pelagomonas_calceolata.AAC.3
MLCLSLAVNQLGKRMCGCAKTNVYEIYHSSGTRKKSKRQRPGVGRGQWDGHHMQGMDRVQTGDPGVPRKANKAPQFRNYCSTANVCHGIYYPCNQTKSSMAKIPWT